ncbi:hypothetical protein FBU30_004152 [Linnemannia zychae]|nr:hypothetical protein FBU30_004152 [Linnemannia zychae]
MSDLLEEAVINDLLRTLNDKSTVMAPSAIYTIQQVQQYSQDINANLLQQQNLYTRFNPCSASDADRAQSDKIRTAFLSKIYDLQGVLPDLAQIDPLCALYFYHQIDFYYATEEQSLIKEHEGYHKMGHYVFTGNWEKRYMDLLGVIHIKRQELKKVSFGTQIWSSLAKVVQDEMAFVKNHPLFRE